MTTTATEPNYMYGHINQMVAFEGASTNYKNGLKGLLSGEPDQLAAREIRYLQLRSAHAIRNNGYAAIAQKRWVTNANAINILWKDPKGKTHKIMQKLWDEFCLNPNYDGIGDYNTTQGVSNSSIFIDGNSYIRKLIIRSGNTNIVPLKLQLIPAPLHAIGSSKPLNQINPGEIARYGITFNNGIPIEYVFRKGQLDLTIEGMRTGMLTVVPANEIVHTFIRTSPGQWIGIPMLSSVLLSLYELDELVSAVIDKQKASQVISMVVTNANNTVNMLAVGAPGYRTDSDGTEKLVMQNKSTGVQYVNKGEDVKWFQGGDIGNNFQPLLVMELRKIAAVCDLMLHELNGDTASLNFSALMGLSLLSRNRLEYLHNFLFIPLRERPIANAFKELAVLYNSNTANARPYFQLPKFRALDELKDTQADLLAVQNGLESYENILAERGLTPDDIIADRETTTELEQFGIYLNSAGGTKQMAQSKNIRANPNSVGI